MIKTSSIGEIITDATLNELDRTLNTVNHNFKDKKDFHLQRETLKIIVTLEKIRKNNIGIRNTRVDFAKSYEEEADFHPAFLIKAHALELAMREYINLGDKIKPSELKDKIRDAYRLAEDKGEYTEIKTEVKIPKTEIDEVCDLFVKQPTLNDSLKLLAFHPILIPSVKKAKENAEKEMDQSILMKIIPPTPIVGDLKKATIEGEEEKFKWTWSRHILYHIQLQTTLLLALIINRLRDEKGLNSNNLMEYFSKWGLMDPRNYSVVEVGFERYFTGDYVSAIHILVPQFESALRRLLSKGGVDITKYDAGDFEERTFGRFLALPDVEKILGEDLNTYIKIIMTDQTAYNLRNNVAHGLLGKAHFTREPADIVFHLFILLTRFTLVEKKNKEKA
jgi:hypothetical protein